MTLPTQFRDTAVLLLVFFAVVAALYPYAEYLRSF